MIFKRFIPLVCWCWLSASVIVAAPQSGISWDSTSDQVSADVRQQPLFPVLEVIARQTGWHIFVEPEAARLVDVKFSGLATGEALKRLLDGLNYSFVPRTNGPCELYVFVSVQAKATQPLRGSVVADSHVKTRVPNELLLKLKPGADADAIARSVGATIVGRDDKLGIYRLRFADEAAMESGLEKLKKNSDVLAAEYNYYFPTPLKPQPASDALGIQNSPAKLTLDASKLNDPCHPIVAVIDTAVQSLGPERDPFVMKPVYVTEEMQSNDSSPTHGTAMVSAILDALAQSSGGQTGVRILPVVVYGSGEQTTTWNVALGVQAAVNNGANVLNMSLGGANNSEVLNGIIQQAIAKGVVVFAAAGNQPITAPTYPAAIKGVNAVTALSAPGTIAPYANYGAFVSMALPGANIVRQGGHFFMAQGTSTATAYASGIAAGTKSVNCQTWGEIQNAMQQKFPVPQK